jgi:chromatin remodeling complex protein RSC6
MQEISAVCEPEFWRPPSQEIQNLFEIHTSIDATRSIAKVEPEYGFTAEEYAKMPSTLAKIIRRMDTLKSDVEKQKRQLAETYADLKATNTLLARYANKYLKPTLAETKKKPRGFACPTRVSDKLCDFMGKLRGSKISRTETSTFLSKYIEEKGLQDSARKNVIVPDEALIKLFGKEAFESEDLTYFTMQKYLSPHFISNK